MKPILLYFYRPMPYILSLLNFFLVFFLSFFLFFRHLSLLSRFYYSLVFFLNISSFLFNLLPDFNFPSPSNSFSLLLIYSLLSFLHHRLYFSFPFSVFFLLHAFFTHHSCHSTPPTSLPFSARLFILSLSLSLSLSLISLFPRFIIPFFRFILSFLPSLCFLSFFH